MRTLLLQPQYKPSFWSMAGALALGGKKVFMPPLALITVAALLPQDWDFRLVETNARDVTQDDWDWAELVLISGMIVQKDHMIALIAEAKRRGKTVAVGGPYATSTPEAPMAAGADYLVLDEGEITIPLFVAALARGDSHGTFRSGGEKADMTQSPCPRYDLLTLRDYGEMNLQISRGCPYLCEFCDIIILYGRRPRMKNWDQIETELDTLNRMGWRRPVFIADDNFIGNRPRVKDLLTRMADWQRRAGYPFTLTTEASINLADDLELVDMMIDANFRIIFVGIETADEESLAAVRKTQNLRGSMTDKVQALKSRGINVHAGLILGFDGEKPGADQRLIELIETAAIPVCMVSVLEALPKTHLTQRLALEGRLVDRGDSGTMGHSHPINFVPTRSTREILTEYRAVIDYIYSPPVFLKRVYRNCLALRRDRLPKKKFVVEAREIFGLFQLLYRRGIRSEHRGLFWRLLFAVRRKNPAAVRAFLSACAAHEHFGPFREIVLQDIDRQLATGDPAILDRVYTPDVAA